LIFIGLILAGSLSAGKVVVSSLPTILSKASHSAEYLAATHTLDTVYLVDTDLGTNNTLVSATYGIKVSGTYSNPSKSWRIQMSANDTIIFGTDSSTFGVFGIGTGYYWDSVWIDGGVINHCPDGQNLFTDTAKAADSIFWADWMEPTYWGYSFTTCNYCINFSGAVHTACGVTNNTSFARGVNCKNIYDKDLSISMDIRDNHIYNFTCSHMQREWFLVSAVSVNSWQRSGLSPPVYDIAGNVIYASQTGVRNSHGLGEYFTNPRYWDSLPIVHVDSNTIGIDSRSLNFVCGNMASSDIDVIRGQSTVQSYGILLFHAHPSSTVIGNTINTGLQFAGGRGIAIYECGGDYCDSAEGDVTPLEVSYNTINTHEGPPSEYAYLNGSSPVGIKARSFRNTKIDNNTVTVTAGLLPYSIGMNLCDNVNKNYSPGARGIDVTPEYKYYLQSGAFDTCKAPYNITVSNNTVHIETLTDVDSIVWDGCALQIDGGDKLQHCGSNEIGVEIFGNKYDVKAPFVYRLAGGLTSPPYGINVHDDTILSHDTTTIQFEESGTFQLYSNQAMDNNVFTDIVYPAGSGIETVNYKDIKAVVAEDTLASAFSWTTTSEPIQRAELDRTVLVYCQDSLEQPITGASIGVFDQNNAWVGTLISENGYASIIVPYQFWGFTDADTTYTYDFRGSYSGFGDTIESFGPGWTEAGGSVTLTFPTEVSNLTPFNNSGWTLLHDETFDTPDTLSSNLDVYGTDGWLTFYNYAAGTIYIKADSGYGHLVSSNFDDVTLLRSTDTLPDEYKIRVKIGKINFGLDQYDMPTDSLDPNFNKHSGNLENGIYWLCITHDTCYGTGASECQEDWWHLNRKIIIDSDEHIVWGSCTPPPCSTVSTPLYTIWLSPDDDADDMDELHSWDTTTGDWAAQDLWRASIVYSPDEWYWVEFEKYNDSLVMRVYDSNQDTLIETKHQSLTDVTGFGASPANSPGWFYMGDPHHDDYEGDAKIGEIQIWVPTVLPGDIDITGTALNGVTIQ